MLRLVVYRLIECLAYMGHSSIWKLICAISVSNILTVGVHLSSTPSKSILDPPLLTIPESKLSDIKERQNMDHKITWYETAIDLLIIVSQWLPRQNTGKSDNLTDHFTNIEIHTCTHTFFPIFQQLGGNGSTVNLMPINWEFLQLQFDTKQSSVLRKKYPRKNKHAIASGLPTLRGHGQQSKELGKNPSVLFEKHRQIVQTQIRNRLTQRLIRVSTVLLFLQNVLWNWKMIPNTP